MTMPTRISAMPSQNIALRSGIGSSRFSSLAVKIPTKRSSHRTLNDPRSFPEVPRVTTAMTISSPTHTAETSARSIEWFMNFEFILSVAKDLVLVACYVYIISNANQTLYIGMTVDLVRRMIQHKNGTFRNNFTRRYNFDRLVYFEESTDRAAAARREKQLKGWTRARKVALITAMNPEWQDLSSKWDDPLCLR